MLFADAIGVAGAEAQATVLFSLEAFFTPGTFHFIAFGARFETGRIPFIGLNHADQFGSISGRICYAELFGFHLYITQLHHDTASLCWVIVPVYCGKCSIS